MQNWLTGTWANQGFMVYQAEDGTQNTTHWRKFSSGEYGDTARRLYTRDRRRGTCGSLYVTRAPRCLALTSSRP